MAPKNTTKDLYAVVRVPCDMQDYVGATHKILRMKFSIGDKYWTWVGGDCPYEVTHGERRLHKGNPCRRKLFAGAKDAVEVYTLGLHKQREGLMSAIRDVNTEVLELKRLGVDIYKRTGEGSGLR